MSTKVFYAYLFKENAEFGDLDKAREYLADLRDKFIEWVPKDMMRWAEFNKDVNDTIDVIRAIEKDTKDPFKGGVWDYQLQATVFAKTLDGVNYIAFQFFPSNGVVKFNIGKDGNLYVDYWCNCDYSKLQEVDLKTFNKHRAEAYKKWQEENADEDE